MHVSKKLIDLNYCRSCLNETYQMNLRRKEWLFCSTLRSAALRAGEEYCVWFQRYFEIPIVPEGQIVDSDPKILYMYIKMVPAAEHTSGTTLELKELFPILPCQQGYWLCLPCRFPSETHPSFPPPLSWHRSPDSGEFCFRFPPAPCQHRKVRLQPQ